jgi:hypothetical protein
MELSEMMKLVNVVHHMNTGLGKLKSAFANLDFIGFH